MGCDPKLPMRRPADQVTLRRENIVNDGMGGSEALSRLRRFEALRLSFASSKRLMRVLGSIVGAQALLRQARQPNVAQRRAIGSEFVGDDRRRNEALPPKQLPEQPRRCGLAASGLNQQLENLALARRRFPGQSRRNA